MSPLVYSLVGLIVGGSVVALVVLLVRRGAANSGVEAEVVRRLEMIDRGLRDEFSRNREEASASARAQREELGASLKNVSDSTSKWLGEISASLRGQLEQVVNQSGKLADKVDDISRMGWPRCNGAIRTIGFEQYLTAWNVLNVGPPFLISKHCAVD